MRNISGVLDHHVPSAYVLEAPYTSANDYITNENACTLKAVNFLGSRNMESDLAIADLEFRTDSWIRYIDKPVFILHAEDDPKVSFDLGGKTIFENCNSVGSVASTSGGIYQFQGYHV